MRFKAYWLSAIALLLAVATGVAFAGQEEKIALEDLPAAVADAVKGEFPNGQMIEAEKEVENGQTVYEVEVADGDEQFEVEVSADGKILEVESADDDD